MRKGSAAAAVLLIFFSFTHVQAGAKDDLPLSQLLTNKFSSSNPLELSNTGHAAHFNTQPVAIQTLDLLNRGIAAQAATLPLGSSSGGFTYTFDPALGVYDRSAESFGPLFGERAVTAGKGKLNIGFNYIYSEYDEFEGIGLQDGEFFVNLIHADLNGDGSTLDPWFEGDFITANYRIDLKTQTFAAFANYGVTDMIDVGIAIPIIKIEMDATIEQEIHDLATGDDLSISHTFDPDCDVFVDPNSCQKPGAVDNFATEELSDSASGIGDVVVRTKVRLKSGPSGDVAVGMDLRLPTGDDEELLGIGSTQTKISLILSGPPTQFSPHGNIGYTVSTGDSPVLGEISNELNYTVGFDAALGQRVSINADLLGRTIFDIDRLELSEREFEFRQGIGMGGTPTTVIGQEWTSEEGDVTQVYGAAGVKWNVFGNFLLNLSGLFSLSNQGLQDRFTGVIGIDYTF